MSFRNLSKTIRYVNEKGDGVTFEYDYGYLINKPVGIDTVQVDLSQAQGIDQIGGTVQSVSVQPRPITVSGMLVGPDQAERKTKLMAVIRPDIPGRLYADDVYLDVYVTATPTIEPRPAFSRFQFSVMAPYPYWKKERTVSQVLSGVGKQFKFPWNISRAYRFGQLMRSKFVTVRNPGQLPAPFTAVLHGADEAVNPKITNVLTGEMLLINKTIAQGEWVVVEITHDRTTVTSSVDGDIRGALDLGSGLFRLGVGDNVLKPEADSGLDQLEVEIRFAPEIVGVAL